MPFLKDFRLRTAQDEGDRKLLAEVARHGFYMLGISDQGERESVEYVFTVGCYYSWGIPEAVVYGFAWEPAKILLREYTRWARDRAAPWALAHPGELAQTAIRPRPVDRSWHREELGYARWFYRDWPKPIPCLQLCWSDRQGRFPDDSQFDPALRARQPDRSKPKRSRRR